VTCPLVPVTETVVVPGGVCEAVEIVKMAVAFCPTFTKTLVGLTLYWGQPIARHETGAVKLTVPENPLKLDTTIVVWPDEPCLIVSMLGIADIRKSGWLADETWTEPVKDSVRKPPPSAAVPEIV